MSTRRPAASTVVDERWRDSASRELMSYRLPQRRRAGRYRGLRPADAAHWLLGRIAAKDAVRHALWDAGPPPSTRPRSPSPTTPTAGPSSPPPARRHGPRPGRRSAATWVGAAVAGPAGPAPGVAIDVVDAATAARAAAAPLERRRARPAAGRRGRRGGGRAVGGPGVGGQAGGRGRHLTAVAGPADRDVTPAISEPGRVAGTRHDVRLQVGDRGSPPRPARPGAGPRPAPHRHVRPQPGAPGTSPDEKEYVIAWTD